MNNTLELLLSGQQFKKLYEKKCHQISEKYGLNKIEIEILLFFDSHQEYDTAKDIVDLKFFAKSHVSKAITSLIHDGYLCGKHDEEDRRCVHLNVTDHAKQVIQEAKDMRQDLLTILYKNISEEEREIMVNVAKKLADNIKEAIEKDQ